MLKRYFFLPAPEKVFQVCNVILLLWISFCLYYLWFHSIQSQLVPPLKKKKVKLNSSTSSLPSTISTSLHRNKRWPLFRFSYPFQSSSYLEYRSYFINSLTLASYSHETLCYPHPCFMVYSLFHLLVLKLFSCALVHFSFCISHFPAFPIKLLTTNSSHSNLSISN